MLVITSDYEEAVQVADRVYVMSKGQIVADLEGDADHHERAAGSRRRIGVPDDEELDGPGRAAPEALETGAACGRPRSAPALGRVEPRSRVSIPETAALFVVLVVLFVFFSATSEFFFNSNNIINILQNVARAGIIACPATILLIAGQFDLSVGSTAALRGHGHGRVRLRPGDRQDAVRAGPVRSRWPSSARCWWRSWSASSTASA